MSTISIIILSIFTISIFLLLFIFFKAIEKIKLMEEKIKILEEINDSKTNTITIPIDSITNKNNSNNISNSIYWD